MPLADLGGDHSTGITSYYIILRDTQPWFDTLVALQLKETDGIAC